MKNMRTHIHPKKRTHSTPLLDKITKIQTKNYTHSRAKTQKNLIKMNKKTLSQTQNKIKLTNELLTISAIAGHGRAKRTIYPTIIGIYMISVIATQGFLYFYQPCYYLELYIIICHLASLSVFIIGNIVIPDDFLAELIILLIQFTPAPSIIKHKSMAMTNITKKPLISIDTNLNTNNINTKTSNIKTPNSDLILHSFQVNNEVKEIIEDESMSSDILVNNPFQVIRESNTPKMDTIT